MIEDVKTILVMVEMNDGKIRQVLAKKEIKEACLHFMSKDGTLHVTEEIMPFEIEYKDKK